MSSSFPDLVTILVNLGTVIPAIIMLLQGIASLIGLYLTASGLTELWGVSHDGALKYIPGKNRFSVNHALIKLLIGSILAAMGTLELVGILSRTLTSDYANSRMLSYSAGGNSLQEQTQLATLALLGIMQIVGFIAMVKGWLVINNFYGYQSQAGLGTASAWLIGGILAWNFKWFADVINNTIGFNVIGMFTPF